MNIWHKTNNATGDSKERFSKYQRGMQGLKKATLSLKEKVGFGVYDLGGNLFFTVVAFLLLNYLTDTVGISAGLASLIIVIGKVWDAITDPITGYLSDRTKSRWGRRRSFMLYGAVPLFVTMFLMFLNPGLSSPVMLFIWGLTVYCLLCTAHTVVSIPYGALTPELTRDFHERTELNGYRFGFAVVGTLIGAGAALPLVGAFHNKNTGFAVMGATFGFIMMVTTLATVFTVKESTEPRREAVAGFFRTYLDVFRNKAFLLILLAFVFHITAITIVSGITIYYFKYIHNDEAKTTVAMVVLLVTTMLFIPVSVILAKKLGKKIVYILGMLEFAITMMILFVCGHVMPVGFSIVLMFFSGIGMGLMYAIPHAIVPDAVEYNYLLTGERTEGAYYGIMAFGTKIGQAMALGIMGAILSLFGYIPEVAQTDSSLLGIRLLLGPISALIFLMAILAVYFYPIDEKRYSEILAQIDEKDDKREL